MTSSRAVLVTGGSRGIGRVIARSFAERGDRVAVHYGASRDRAAQVLAELPGPGLVLVQAHMEGPLADRRMLDGAAPAPGRLDGRGRHPDVLLASVPLPELYGA